jgi:hypothetical protein
MEVKKLPLDFGQTEKCTFQHLIFGAKAKLHIHEPIDLFFSSHDLVNFTNSNGDINNGEQ